MASIKKHKTGGWRAIVHRRKLGIYKSKVLPTKAAAERWARAIERDIDEGKYRDTTLADTLTLADALDRYLDTVAKKKKGRGYECNVSQARQIKKHKISKKPLSHIKTADVIAYRDERLKTRSPDTVRLELALISHVFTVARRDWDIEGLANPVLPGVRPSGRERNRRLSPEEASALLATAADYGDGRMLHIITLAIETAMRRGEIVSLLWENVDLEKRIAFLPETKNGEARVVPLTRKAVDAVIALGPKEEGSVTGYNDGKSLHQALKRILQRAGLSQDIRFHDLRHEGTSRLFEKGLEAMQASAITGHKSLAMLKRYTHLRPHDLVAVLDAAEKDG